MIDPKIPMLVYHNLEEGYRLLAAAFSMVQREGTTGVIRFPNIVNIKAILKKFHLSLL
jgi:hypothetical protein